MLDVWSLIQVCAKTLTGRRALVRHAAVTGIRPRCLPGWSWSKGFDDSLQQTDGTVELEWRIGRKVSTSWLIWFLGPLTCCWVGQIRKAFVAQIDFQNDQPHSSNLHVTLNSRQLQLDTTRSTYGPSSEVGRGTLGFSEVGSHRGQSCSFRLPSCSVYKTRS